MKQMNAVLTQDNLLLDAGLVDDHQADHATGGAVASHGVRDRCSTYNAGGAGVKVVQG